MRKLAALAVLAAAMAALAGCTSYISCGTSCASPCGGTPVVSSTQTSRFWSLSDARVAEKLEIQVDHAGNRTEVEYHILPDAVPEAVRKAMDELHPGGPFIGAEKEFENGVLYYELTREVDGFEVEAMFTPSGSLHSEEIAVAADTVPDVVKAGVSAAYPGGTVKVWEEIRGSKRELKEYHVKLTDGGLNYKVVVTLGGTVARAVREVPAEVEVPVPVRRGS